MSPPQPFDVDVKRFYMPGQVLKSVCPKCDEAREHDFTHDYLSYPTANEPIDVHMHCYTCDTDWKVQAILTVHIDLVPDPV